jgi:TPR repeat protein
LSSVFSSFGNGEGAVLCLRVGQAWFNYLIRLKYVESKGLAAREIWVPGRGPKKIFKNFFRASEVGLSEKQVTLGMCYEYAKIHSI